MHPLVLTHPACLLHHPGRRHPEQPARLEAALRGAAAGGARIESTCVQADRAQLVAAHSARHVDALLAARGRPFAVDAETLGSAESIDAALWAAGAVVDGVRRIVAGTEQRVLAWVRPPGHHAEAGQAMGFCFFNNVAVGVHEARRLGLHRVAVVDVDVHLGNGTQQIFAMDPRVLVIDVHEEDLYPQGGSAQERGVGAGWGTTINVPLRRGEDADYQRIMEGLVASALRRFAPELVVVSLGFDAHALDPLAHMALSSAGFGVVVAQLAALADDLCGGRLLVVLEGGYHLDAVEASSRAVVEALVAPSVGLPEGSSEGPSSWADALDALEQGLVAE
jgi:acetoin utilization deacetylase AcuC-like enzyme